ncbi:sugar transferase [Roseicitreum antarcticum]|uniref:Sugar transferase involved in LPS biosynthesis (Colanic, teichoic acid) n=1 Tax=Roseicitreum antarcticum TaxID=564137 RepID=A0A1H2R7C8_9RHOB|nr:sugar transferase [Roseicitreum antarcticum]SDW15225.1 Sugar transferase involved in LPS biosynthesis (colanic, teichoic acid) [Roseicitreum antarcticum]
MTWKKRIFDLAFLLAISWMVVPVLLYALVLLRWRDRSPLFYVSERMRAPGQPFLFWKLRTMRPDPGDSGVSGGHKTARLTPTGRLLRRTRGDELPQAWNIIRGDLSLVGPRAPLRLYVEAFPELYARVLRARPGITGLATLVYSQHEQKLLAQCSTPAETDATYRRRCIPYKARLDLLYQRHASVRTDLWLIAVTAGRAFGLLPRHSRRLPRRRRKIPMGGDLRRRDGTHASRLYALA